MSKGPTYYRNKYPGVCEHCGRIVRSREGRVRRNRCFEWFTSHPGKVEIGWPPKLVGGCPPRPEVEPTPPQEPTAAQARAWLFTTFYGDGEPPHTPYADPTAQAEEDAILVRLAAEKPLDLFADRQLPTALVMIARRHRWADPR